MSDLSSPLIHFDLPPLDDNNSILLDNDVSSETQSEKEKKFSLTIELIHEKQSYRLPVDWKFEEKSEKTVSDDTIVPIYSILQKKIVTNPKLQPLGCFMPTADFEISEDQPVPVYFVSHHKLVQETTTKWKSALLKSTQVPIHNCAVEFNCLFDLVHQGFIKTDLGTNQAPAIEHCVLTSTENSLLSLSVEAAMMENPLLNALAVAAVSDCWFELSPTILLQIIDQNVYRFRKAQDKNSAEKTKLFANFCVEDTTASVESISASVLSKKNSLTVNYWNNSEFYYDFFSTKIADALNQQFAGQEYSKFSQDAKSRLAAMKVALCAQNSTRIVSAYDSAKCIYACEKTFIHPSINASVEPSKNSNAQKNQSDSSSTFKKIIANYCEDILGCQDSTLIESSTTLAENCKTNCSLNIQRSQKTIEIESSETLKLHDNVFQANKFIFSGHYGEWRALIKRLKVQIQDAPQDLKVWLSAMFWLVLNICNAKKDYEHPKGIHTPNCVEEKDKKFLQIAVGKEFSEMDKNFLTKFFWFNPTENLVGGLALLFFPFEAELFISIANNDLSTNRLFPYKNGALMRVHGHLLAHGMPTTEIYDIRTTCQYEVHASHVQIGRRIVNGFSGFNCVGLHLCAKDEIDPVLIRPAITAFDIVEYVRQRHLLQVLPEVNSKMDNPFVIDRSLERFALFPTLAYEKGVFMLAIDESTSKGNAGYNEPKVANAFKAASFDQKMMPTIFDAYLANYKQTKKNLFLPQQTQVAAIVDQQSIDEIKNSIASVKVDLVQEEEKLPTEKPRVAVVESVKESEKSSLEKDKIAAAKKQEKLLLAQEKRRQHLLLLQQKREQQKKQENLAVEQKQEKEKEAAKMSQIDQDAALARELQNLETISTETLQEFTLVIGKGKKKKNSVSGLPGNATQMQTQTATTSQVKHVVTAQPIAITSRESSADSVGFVAAQATAVASAESVGNVYKAEKIADETAIEKEPIDIAVVESKPVTVSSTLVESNVDSEPNDIDVVEMPAVQESLAITAESIINASFYKIPTEQVVDKNALHRFAQSICSSVQHVRYWLDLASRDRAFSHEKHVLLSMRSPYNIDHLKQHLCLCTDETMHMYTPWSLLTTAFEKMVENTPPNTNLTTLIINGCQNSILDPRMQLLSRIGKLIFDSVLNMAAYSLTETRTNSACSTCYLCRIAAPMRFAFIPQYIDANHTMVTRMLPMCNDERCSLSLLQKVSDRTHGDAKFPGLRVFFHFNNSISICESEQDLYKYTINQSSQILPALQRFSNADFAMPENAIMLRDDNGNFFALPQAVAQKAYLLAQFFNTRADTEKN